MKKNLLILIILLISFSAFSQTKVYPTGAKAKTPDMQEYYNRNIKELKINRSKNKTSRSASDIHYVDNSKSKFFPPVFCQIGGSCAQAAGVGYIYTYEVNCMLNRDASKKENRFSYMYAWNLLNGGKGNGTNEYEGWFIARENGIITSSDFDPSSDTEWANGYDKYINGMQYTIEDYSKINSRNKVEEAILSIKQYLIDHGNGSEHGGLLSLSALAHSMRGNIVYDGPSNTGYTCIVPKFSKSGAHCMTIVGYDDKVEWDLDKNGEISESEKGAFIVVNSWGKSWGDNGRYYMPYALLSKRYDEGGCFSEFLTVKPKIISPKLYYKIKMSHSSRNDIRFVLGVSTTPGATEPEYEHDVFYMRHSGGDHPLRGISPEQFYPTLELALKADKLIEYIGDCKNPKYYLKVVDEKRGDDVGEGEIVSFSVVDCRNEGEQIELVCDYEYEALEVNKKTSIYVRAIEYDFEEEGVAFKIAQDSDKNYDVIVEARDNIQATIDILDGDRNIVKTLLTGELSAGLSKYKIDKADLTSGTYAIRIFTHKQIVFRQIHIQ